MYVPLLTPAECAARDRRAMDGFGVKPEMLMENAAREALRVLREELGGVTGLDVVLLAGSGNNGGDAFALARHLLDAGAVVLVVGTKPLGAWKAEAGYHARLAVRCGVEFRPVSRLRAHDLFALLRDADVIVDGLLGTGFRGPLRPDLRELVRMVNDAADSDNGPFVLALDIPSGLDGITGLPSPVAVRADLTATFGAAKLGLAMPGAADFAGRVEVCEIGIPELVRRELPASHFLLDEDVWEHLPVIDPAMHKGSAGHVLVCGGSPGLTGAPHLAGLAALRAGAGLVTCAAPADLCPEIKAGVPDLMTLPLPGGSTWSAASVQALTPILPRIDAIVAGPGLGRDSGAGDFLEALLRAAPDTPLVLDADGLTVAGARPGLLELAGARAVLTPHPGEMSRLCGSETTEIQARRVETAREFAVGHGLTLVLKGAGSVVADRDGRVYILPVTAPNLAVGGSGDVLSGLLASLLGRGLPSAQAACLAVYWHGLAGERLAGRFPNRGNLASEIAGVLPEIPDME